MHSSEPPSDGALRVCVVGGVEEDGSDARDALAAAGFEVMSLPVPPSGESLDALVVDVVVVEPHLATSVDALRDRREAIVLILDAQAELPDLGSSRTFIVQAPADPQRVVAVVRELARRPSPEATNGGADAASAAAERHDAAEVEQEALSGEQSRDEGQTGHGIELAPPRSSRPPRPDLLTPMFEGPVSGPLTRRSEHPSTPPSSSIPATTGPSTGWPRLSLAPPDVRSSAPPDPSPSSPPPMAWPSFAPEARDLHPLALEGFGGPTSLSPDLERLLQAAQDRVLAETASSSDIPSPEAEVDAILPPDVLAALDEPLLDAGVEDEPSDAGSSVHTPMGTTGAGRAASLLRTRGGAEPVTRNGQPDDEASVVREPPEQEQTAAPLSSAEEPIVRAAQGYPDPFSDLEMGVVSTPGVNAVSALVRSDTRRPVPPPVVIARQPAAVARPPSSRPSRAAGLLLPQVLTAQLDGLRLLGQCIGDRATVSLCIEEGPVQRRVVMRDGDFVTCASNSAEESLVAFLVIRGDMPREIGSQLVGKVPAAGRHAAAALIANGFLWQDQLWTVLRAHAEWVLGRVARQASGTAAHEVDPPGRLGAEPAVFGGATGAEVLIEIARRVLSAQDALGAMGGLGARLGDGRRKVLLAECALNETERSLVESSIGRSVAEVLEDAGTDEFAPVLAGCAALEVLEVIPLAVREERQVNRSETDDLDAAAVRRRVKARLAIVEEGDYFEVLGVARGATSYEVRRAYLEMRRAFEPSRLLTAATADLADDVRLLLDVTEEAYEVLRDASRRERYRRAIEAQPPRS